MVVLGQKWLNSGKLFLSVKSCCIREKWLHSGKSCCIPAKWWLIRAKLLNSGKSVSIQAKYMYSGKEVVFGQGGFIRARLFFSGKIVVVFGESGCKPAKVVVFREKLLYWGK